MKRCAKCEMEKPATLEYFARDGGRKDGLQPYCKECNAAYRNANREKINNTIHIYNESHKDQRRAWRESRFEETRVYNRDYRQANRDRLLERDRVYRSENADKRKANNRQWRQVNSDRVRATQSEYRKANLHRFREYRKANRHKIIEKDRRLRAARPDRYRAYNQKYRTKKAGAGGRGVTEQDIQAMIYCQMGLCAYCERDGQKLTLDHIIPIDQGGPHDPDNCCMACGVCNSSKGARTPDQWVDRWYLR